MSDRNLALILGAVLLLQTPAANADVVQQWNGIMLQTVAGQNPFAAARVAAITQLAMFEAVNAIEGEFEPYLGGITAAPGASAEAAAVAAAHRVLATYFPDPAAVLDQQRAESLAALSGTGVDDGVAVGEAAAAALIAVRAGDGSGSPLPYTPLSGPGFWQPTPPAFSAGILRHWGLMTPFGLTSGSQFRLPPPPALTSNEYRKDYDEVKAVGGVASARRPQDRTDVARFYAVTGAAHVWNPVCVEAAVDRGSSLVELARALALLNMAISDGLVASLDTKYHYHFWRPVTAIRAGDTDGNERTHADPDFLPLVATPPFPSYPSAHASASYAARTVIESLFGGRASVTL